MNCSKTIQNGLIVSFGALLGDQIFSKVTQLRLTRLPMNTSYNIHFTQLLSPNNHPLCADEQKEFINTKDESFTLLEGLYLIWFVGYCNTKYSGGFVTKQLQSIPILNLILDQQG